MKQRIALLVYVDLDPVPGEFHTEASVRHVVANMLDKQIGQYNPIVSHAPDELQPPNKPPRVSDSQEIPITGTGDSPSEPAVYPTVAYI